MEDSELQYRVEVSDEFMNLEWTDTPYFEWCKRHTGGNWDMLRLIHGRVRVKFALEEDAMLFKLKFG